LPTQVGLCPGQVKSSSA